MQDKHVFEYAIIRVLPKVERGEFINIGVVLYCSAQRFLQVKYELNTNKLLSLFADVNIAEIEQILSAFDKICCGGKQGGDIGLLPLASRFRWLTAAKSTIIQTSAVHPGLTSNAAETLDRLFAQLVL